MNDKKSTTGSATLKRKRSIPKARLLLETQAVLKEYDLNVDDSIGVLVTAIEKSIVDEQVAALN